MNLDEKAVSKKQQRFFGMVRAAHKGELENPSSEIVKVADNISVKDAKDFASTKHKGLPEKKKLKEEDTYSQKNKEIKKTKKPRDERYKTLHKSTNVKGNIDVNEEKTFDDFRLTLKTHKELNPKIWTDKKLDPEIATNLVKIGKEWAKFAEIPENVIDDYIIVGGNANFNYTKYSDIDLHLVVDKKKLGCEGCLDDFLRAKKQLWALTHNITIKGHPVELYAQDIDETVGSKGQYSLKQKKWTQEPTPYKLNRKDPEVVKKVKDFIYQIDTLINAKSDDKVVFQNLKDKIGTMRKAAIQRAGEYAPENLVFKELRNRGYVEKVWNYLRDLGDKELSVEEIQFTEGSSIIQGRRSSKKSSYRGPTGDHKRDEHGHIVASHYNKTKTEYPPAPPKKGKKKKGQVDWQKTKKKKKSSYVPKTPEQRKEILRTWGKDKKASALTHKLLSRYRKDGNDEKQKKDNKEKKKNRFPGYKSPRYKATNYKNLRPASERMGKKNVNEELEETTWSAMILLPSNKRRKVTFNAPSMSRKDALQIVKALYGATDVTQLNRLKYRRFKRVNEDVIDEIYGSTFDRTKEKKKMEDSEKKLKERNLRMKYGKNWKTIVKAKNKEKTSLRPGEVKRLVRGKWVSNKD